ncbi:MAG: 50S ribosomal protein L24 [Candidatus Dadabacteria bacterium]|nr:50S ribosomal protein L24 [Candidatus Dadabacteria bacterium]
MSAGKTKFNIKSGDMVYVIAGKEKGKMGKVLRIDSSNEQVFVEKLNIIKRHSRPTQKNPGGGIIEKEAGIHVSNLMLYDSENQKPVKVGYRTGEDGIKVRYNRKTGKEI